MLSTEAKFVTISAIFFSLACVAEVILPRLYNNVCEAASRSLFWTTNELNELPEVRFEFPFSLNSMAVLSSWAHERRSRGQQNSRAPISSRFLCPRPPLFLSAPNQNRHATQANFLSSWLTNRQWLSYGPIMARTQILIHRRGGQSKDFWEMLFCCLWNMK